MPNEIPQCTYNEKYKPNYKTIILPRMLISDTDHLLYIQISDICYSECQFCMYKNNRNNDVLSLESDIAMQNIYHLVDLAERIGISGQGEPIVEIDKFYKLLQIVNGKTFEFITSADTDTIDFQNILFKINHFCKTSNNTCKIRISLDRFHLNARRFNNFHHILNEVMKWNGQKENIELFFRSITIDKVYILDYLTSLIEKEGIPYRVEIESPLRISLYLSGIKTEIIFQNFVNIGELGISDLYTLDEYLYLLEREQNRPFTLGHYNKQKKKALDLTLNPDGTVTFYGLEFLNFGSIYKDNIKYSLIKDQIINDEVASRFIEIPFRRIISHLRSDKALSKRIDFINNPYWIVKDLYEHHHDALIEMILKMNYE